MSASRNQRGGSWLTFGHQVSLEHLEVGGYATSAGLADTGVTVRRVDEDKIENDEGHNCGLYLGFESSVYSLVTPVGTSISDGLAYVTYGARVSLRHRQSGLYLALLPAHPAHADPTCHAVQLVSRIDATMTSHFKFLPRYKVHAEGDRIAANDQVIVQLFDKPLFLHVTEPGATAIGQSMSLSSFGSGAGGGGSASSYGSVDHQDSMGAAANSLIAGESSGNFGSGPGGGSAASHSAEVNGSHNPATFTVRRYDVGCDSAAFRRVADGADRRGVVTGAPIVLFHRELEALLISTASLPPPMAAAAADESTAGTSAGGATGGGVDGFNDNASIVALANQGTSTSFADGPARMRGASVIDEDAMAGTLSAAASTVGRRRGGSIAAAGHQRAQQHLSKMQQAPVVAPAETAVEGARSRATSVSQALHSGSGPKFAMPSAQQGAEGGGGRGVTVDASPVLADAVRDAVAGQPSLLPLMRQIQAGFAAAAFTYHTGFKEDVPFIRDAAVSCGALWVLEYVDPRVGGPVRYGLRYRLRHVATGSYLAVLDTAPGRTGADARNADASEDEHEALNDARNWTFATPSTDADSACVGLIDRIVAGEELVATVFTIHTFYGGTGDDDGGNTGNRSIGPPRGGGGGDKNGPTFVTEKDFVRLKHEASGLFLNTFADESTTADAAPAAASPAASQPAAAAAEQQHQQSTQPAATTGVNGEDSTLLSAGAAPFSRRSSSRAAGAESFGGAEGARSPLAAAATSPDVSVPPVQTAADPTVKLPYGMSSGTVKDLWSLLRGHVALQASRQPALHDALTIAPASTALLRQVVYVSHMAAPLRGASKYFNEEAQLPPALRSRLLPKQELSSCARALANLVCFCTESDDDNPLTREGLPSPQQQRMLFDLQIHRHVFDLLVAPFSADGMGSRASSSVSHGFLDASTNLYGGTGCGGGATATLDTIVQRRGPTHMPSLPLAGGVVSVDDLNKPENKALHDVCRLAYRLLKQMSKDNGKHAAQLADFVPVMYSMDGLKLHVADTMLSLFTNNPHLPTTVFRDAVKHYVRLLSTKARSGGYLKFLSAMSCVGAIGHTSNQRAVVRALLEDCPQVLVRTVLTPGAIGIAVVPPQPLKKKKDAAAAPSPVKEADPLPLEQFLITHGDAKLVKFFESQIELFAKLCVGNDHAATTAVSGFVPSSQAAAVVHSILASTPNYDTTSRLDSIRAHYFSLVVNLYLRADLADDRSELLLQSATVPRSSIRAYDASTNATTALSRRADTPLASAMKTVSMQILRGNTVLVAESTARVGVVSAVLDMWCAIAEWGQYNPEERDELIPLLLKLLDTSTDQVSLKASKQRGAAASAHSPRAGSMNRSASGLGASASAAMSSGSFGSASAAGSSTSGQQGPESSASAAGATTASGGSGSSDVPDTAASLILKKQTSRLFAVPAPDTWNRHERSEGSVALMRVRAKGCTLLRLLMRNAVRRAADIIVASRGIDHPCAIGRPPEEHPLVRECFGAADEVAMVFHAPKLVPTLMDLCRGEDAPLTLAATDTLATLTNAPKALSQLVVRARYLADGVDVTTTFADALLELSARLHFQRIYDASGTAFSDRNIGECAAGVGLALQSLASGILPASLNDALRKGQHVCVAHDAAPLSTLLVQAQEAQGNLLSTAASEAPIAAAAGQPDDLAMSMSIGSPTLGGGADAASPGGRMILKRMQSMSRFRSTSFQIPRTQSAGGDAATASPSVAATENKELPDVAVVSADEPVGEGEEGQQAIRDRMQSLGKIARVESGAIEPAAAGTPNSGMPDATDESTSSAPTSPLLKALVKKKPGSGGWGSARAAAKVLSLTRALNSRGRHNAAAAAAAAAPTAAKKAAGDEDEEEEVGGIPTDEVPPSLLRRVEAMAHWKVHEPILLWLQRASPIITAGNNGATAPAPSTSASSPPRGVGGSASPQLHLLYTRAIEFFFFFALSVDNALLLAPHLQLFLNGLSVESASHQCMYIVVSVMSADKETSGVIDRNLLKRLVALVEKEAKSDRPNASFIRLLNRSVVGTQLIPANQRYLLAKLKSRDVFIDIASASPLWPAEKLLFNSALILLLCNCCAGSSVSRHLAHRLLPWKAVLNILSVMPEADRIDRASRLPYLRVLGSLYLSFDEDESAHERESLRSQWSKGPAMWNFFQSVAVADLRETIGALRGRRMQPAACPSREYVFAGLLGIVTTFFTNMFDARANKSDDAAFAVADLAGSVLQLVREGLRSFNLAVRPEHAKKHRHTTTAADGAGGSDETSSPSPATKAAAESDTDDDEVETAAEASRGPLMLLTPVEWSALRRAAAALIYPLEMYDYKNLADDIAATLPRVDAVQSQAPEDGTADTASEDAQRRRAGTNAASGHAVATMAVTSSSRRRMQSMVRRAPAKPAGEGGDDDDETDVFHGRAVDDAAIDARRAAAFVADNTTLYSTANTAFVTFAWWVRTTGNRVVDGCIAKVLAHMRNTELSPYTTEVLLNLLAAAIVPRAPPDALRQPPLESIFCTDEKRKQHAERVGMPPLIVGPSADNVDASCATGGDASEEATTASAIASSAADDLAANNAQLEQLQSRLDALGAMTLVTTLIEVTHDGIVEAALNLGIAVLEGGNRNVQDNMLLYFESFDERFFHSLRDILIAATSNVKHTNRLRLQQQQLAAQSRSAEEDGGQAGAAAAMADLMGSDGMESIRVDLKFVKEAFRMLQLMCEGHHLGLQNYVREQTDNLHSINILKDVSSLMQQLSQCIDTSNLDVVTQGFALLAEFCQGPCRENQRALLSNGACSLVCRAFDFREAAPEAVDTVKAAAATALLSFVEGCNDTRVYRQVLSQVPIAAVAQQMAMLATRLADDGDPTVMMPRASLSTATLTRAAAAADAGDDEDPAVDVLFSLLIYLNQSLPHADPDSVERIKRLLAKYRHFRRQLGCIEIERHDARGRSDMDDATAAAAAAAAASQSKSHGSGSSEGPSNGALERVYFRIPSVCKALTEKSKDRVLWTVDRTTRSTKLNDFISKTDELIVEIETSHSMQMYTSRAANWLTEGQVDVTGTGADFRRAAARAWRSLVPFFVTHHIAYYDTLMLALAAIINPTLALSLDLTPFTDEAATAATTGGDASSWWWSSLFAPSAAGMAVLGIAKLYCCIAALVVDSLVFLPVHAYRLRRDLREAAAASATTQDDGATASAAAAAAASGGGVLHAILQRVEGNDRLFLLVAAVTRFATLYRIALILAGIGGLFVSPYFYAVHLVGIIDRSAILRNVIVAITQNGRSLLLTMALGVVVIYFFAIIGVHSFADAYGSAVEDNDDDAGASGNNGTSSSVVASAVKDAEGNCNTLMRCFLFILTQGLRQGGGIGDAMAVVPWAHPLHSARLLHDFLFFAVMNVVFLNILFGIIIDTFAELRDDKNTIETDMTTFCFVCGLDSDTLEKHNSTGGFTHHTTVDHDVWQYLYFVHHLRRKDPNDYNGQESYVANCLERHDLSFFPQENCLALENEGRPSLDQQGRGGGGGTGGNAAATASGADGSSGSGITASAAAAAADAEDDALATGAGSLALGIDDADGSGGSGLDALKQALEALPGVDAAALTSAGARALGTNAASQQEQQQRRQSSPSRGGSFRPGMAASLHDTGSTSTGGGGGGAGGGAFSPTNPPSLDSMSASDLKAWLLRVLTSAGGSAAPQPTLEVTSPRGGSATAPGIIRSTSPAPSSASLAAAGSGAARGGGGGGSDSSDAVAALRAQLEEARTEASAAGDSLLRARQRESDLQAELETYEDALEEARQRERASDARIDGLLDAGNAMADKYMTLRERYVAALQRINEAEEGWPEGAADGDGDGNLEYSPASPTRVLEL